MITKESPRQGLTGNGRDISTHATPIIPQITQCGMCGGHFEWQPEKRDVYCLDCRVWNFIHSVLQRFESGMPIPAKILRKLRIAIDYAGASHG